MMSVREQISSEQLTVYTERVEQKRKLRRKGSKAFLIFFLVCVMLGGVIGYLGGRYGTRYLIENGIEVTVWPPLPLKEELDILQFVFLLALYYVMTVLQTIIHEGGHLVFGLLTGYKFLSFRIFSFTIVKKDGKLVRKKFKLAGTAGQCLMVPPEWKENEHYPYVWYNLGGGIMNLIFSLLAVPLLFVKINVLFWCAAIFVFTGAIFAITNMVPMTLGMPNDGKNCLLCKKERVNQKALYAQLKINAMLSEGTEMKNLPEELFAAGAADTVNMLTAAVRLYEYYRYLHLQEKERASECLSTLEKVTKIPVALLNMIDLERMYCMLCDGAPLEEIAAYYAVLRPALLQNKDISVIRIKYAYYSMLTEEEREIIEWLAASKNGKLPKKLPKSKPITAEKVYAEMEACAAKYPVVCEAAFHMELADALSDTTDK